MRLVPEKKNPLSQTVDCRKNFSTVHALIDSIENAFEKSKFVCKVFIVLKKAFDTFFYSKKSALKSSRYRNNDWNIV